MRESTGYPPFGRLASLVISATTGPPRKPMPARSPRPRRTTNGSACSVRPKRRLRSSNGRYRFRLLVKSPRTFDLSAYLRQWLAAGPKTNGNLRLEVDVDPQSFL